MEQLDIVNPQNIILFKFINDPEYIFRLYVKDKINSGNIDELNKVINVSTGCKKNQYNPLLYSIKYKFFLTTKLLIESKVDLDLCQPLLYSVQNNLLDIIELLLEGGATLDPEYLFHCYDIDVMKLLIKYGIPINHKKKNGKTYAQYIVASKLKIPISKRVEILELILPYVDINYFYQGKDNLLMHYMWSSAYCYRWIKNIKS